MSSVIMKQIRTDVLSIPVDTVTWDSALEQVRSMLASQETHLVFAINPEKVMAARQDPELRSSLQAASLLIPDGIGVVLAARLLRGIRMERVPGSDLMPAICGLAAREGHSVFLFGSREGVAANAAAILQQRFPGLQVAGVHDGYVPDEGMTGLLRTINESGAKVLFVGLGSPRQELWLARHRSQLEVRVCQGVGGSFDAICGNPKRAPKAVQNMHLEWLYRLALQPSRAGRQSALPRFVKDILAEIYRLRIGR
jgi:N-acetylglucosaminyldiphosphoundecaprenol N-acetyl-beta-D-mannosaminyltransferase